METNYTKYIPKIPWGCILRDESDSERISVWFPTDILENGDDKEDNVSNHHHREEKKAYKGQDKDTSNNPIYQKTQIEIHNLPEHRSLLGIERIFLQKIVYEHTKPSPDIRHEETDQEQEPHDTGILVFFIDRTSEVFIFHKSSYEG